MTLNNASLAKSRLARKRNTSKYRNIAIVETLEQRVLLTAATGAVDLANNTQIIGWAYDADTPATSITVQVKIDGVVSNVTANQIRNDLIPYIGSPDHGFTFTVPALTPGAHSVVISAADSTSGALTVFKTLTLTNPTPIGHVDVSNTTTVSGWAYDADAGSSPISVRIDSDGSVAQTVSASTARSGLTPVIGSPDHAFSVTGSFGVTDVYALDNPTGDAVLIGSNSVKAKGGVDVLSTTRVAGWAWTPDLGSSPTGIEVDVDGVLYQTATANTSRPDVSSITGSNNNGFDFTLNALSPGTHTVQIFAIDSMTTSANAKVLLATKTLTNAVPKGNIDAASVNGVIGWAYDADAGATGISVQVKVDGSVVTTQAANVRRGDLVSSLGSAYHGFSISFGSALSSSPHEIQVYALDVPTNTAVLLSTKYINNTLPIGALDVANLSTIAGWAYDANSPTTPVNVIVELDGVQDSPTAASIARPDLLSVLPNDAHAFDIVTPTHLAGTHTVTVLAVDTFTGQDVILGTKTFVNHAPRGNVDIYTSTSVVGWAQDPDQPTLSLSHIIISIDGTISETAANINRPGLVPYIGSANHGFSETFTALSTGTHFIEVYAADPITGVSTLIGSKSITVA